MSCPTVSVVIPGWNRAEQLPECLGAIDRQTLPADALEVLVVDDGNSPAIDEAAGRPWNDRPR